MLFEAKIHPDDGGQRLDRYVKKILPSLSVSRIYNLIRTKEVKLDGKPAKKADYIQAGQELRVYGLKEGELNSTSPQKNVSVSGGQMSKISPSSISQAFLSDFGIAYEDENLLVVEKPPGISVQPGSGVPLGASLVERARVFLNRGKKTSDSIFKPSLIHRIDRDTSGLVMIAKTGKALRWWTEQWRARKVEKFYLAICLGTPPEKGVISHELEKKEAAHKGGKSQLGSKSSGTKSKSALTHFKRLSVFGKLSLVQVQIHTGRMHQIRAHFAAEGFPLAGDIKYGNFGENRKLWKLGAKKRLYLHSQSLKGKDSEGVELLLESPIPEAFKKCLEFGLGL